MIKACFSLFILLGLGAFGAVFGITTVDTDRSSANVAATACTGAQLSVQRDTKFGGDSAMGGVRAEQFIVKNNSHSMCTITGNPGITLFDSRGRMMGKGMKPTKKGGAMTLKAGGSATLEIMYHSCVAGETAIEHGHPNRCTWSKTAQIRIPGISRIFSVRSKLDGEPEQIVEFVAR